MNPTVENGNARGADRTVRGTNGITELRVATPPAGRMTGPGTAGSVAVTNGGIPLARRDPVRA